MIDTVNEGEPRLRSLRASWSALLSLARYPTRTLLVHSWFPGAQQAHQWFAQFSLLHHSRDITLMGSVRLLYPRYHSQ